MTLILTTTPATTHELRNGDIISCYGEIMRLKDRRIWPMRKGDCPETQGECITFKVDFLTNGNGIPQSWRKDWTVQGNKLASWARVDNEDMLEAWLEQKSSPRGG